MRMHASLDLWFQLVSCQLVSYRLRKCLILKGIFGIYDSSFVASP